MQNLFRLLGKLVSQFSWQLIAKITYRAKLWKHDVCLALAIELQIMESM